ncbi:MAG: hypothetical protein PVG66_04535 [Chromatiales bacterium]|jgi:hypothetical protein
MSRSSKSLPLSLFARIIGSSLTTLIVLAVLFFVFTYFRIMQIDRDLYLDCQSVSAESMQLCADNVTLDFLRDSQWVALQFSTYTLVAALIFFLFVRKQASSALWQSGIAGVLSSSLLLLVIEPGRLLALTAICGALLGGLLAQRKKPGKAVSSSESA